MFRTGFLSALATLVIGAPLAAAPVDLTTYMQDGRGTWTVGTPTDSVTYSNNTSPSIFYGQDESVGASLSANVRVNTRGDDDWFGFVLGYDQGELLDSAPDYYLLSWRQGRQSSATPGLRLYHVTSPYSDGTAPYSSRSVIDTNFWDSNGGVDEVARAETLGTTGWADQQSYAFDIRQTATNISVFVDGLRQFSFDGAFAGGNFGLYNFSQTNVTFSDVAYTPTAVPLPAALPLLAAGMGALALAARRRRTATA